MDNTAIQNNRQAKKSELRRVFILLSDYTSKSFKHKFCLLTPLRQGSSPNNGVKGECPFLGALSASSAYLRFLFAELALSAPRTTPRPSMYTLLRRATRSGRSGREHGN